MVTLPRLYPILDTTSLAQRGLANWPSVAHAWLSAGIEILQLRHKGEWDREANGQAAEIAEACRDAGVCFIVNDRADFARLLNAGLHVGQDDLTPADCRSVLGAAAVLGFSTHNAEQLAACAEQPVDYVAFGPVHPTASKSNPDPVVGLAQLRAARNAVHKPLVAIGGITRANAHSAFEAGADSVAVISALLPESLEASSLRQRIDEWLELTRP